MLGDPNVLDPTGATSISSIHPSPDGKHIAIVWQHSGSDWMTISIVDSTTGA